MLSVIIVLPVAASVLRTQTQASHIEAAGGDAMLRFDLSRTESTRTKLNEASCVFKGATRTSAAHVSAPPTVALMPPTRLASNLILRFDTDHPKLGPLRAASIPGNFYQKRCWRIICPQRSPSGTNGPFARFQL